MLVFPDAQMRRTLVASPGGASDTPPPKPTGAADKGRHAKINRSLIKRV